MSLPRRRTVSLSAHQCGLVLRAVPAALPALARVRRVVLRLLSLGAALELSLGALQAAAAAARAITQQQAERRQRVALCPSFREAWRASNNGNPGLFFAKPFMAAGGTGGGSNGAGAGGNGGPGALGSGGGGGGGGLTASAGAGGDGGNGAVFIVSDMLDLFDLPRNVITTEQWFFLLRKSDGLASL